MKLLRNSFLYIDVPASEKLLRSDGDLSEDWVVPDRWPVNRRASSLGIKPVGSENAEKFIL